MIGMTSGGILNLFLDPILIFSLKFGISGAAIATMISQIFSCLVMASIFVCGRSIVNLRILISIPFQIEFFKKHLRSL